MNRIVRRVKLPFKVVFISFVVSTAALFVIPFMQYLPKKIEDICGYIFALLFWLGIISGCLAFKFIDRVLKQYMLDRQENSGFNKQKFPGIITFTFKRLNMVMYILMVVGVVLMVSDMIFHCIPPNIMFPVISIVFFSFVMHCIIDGRNYKFYKKILKGMVERV